MFRDSLRLIIASLLILSAACDTAGIEVSAFPIPLPIYKLSEAPLYAPHLPCILYAQSPFIHLSSELDVGRDLMKGCSSIVYEADALCSGRQPYRLYAEPSSSCSSYFWCAPARGACVLACPQGGTCGATAAWWESVLLAIKPCSLAAAGLTIVFV
jgi:hypothetical protein